MKNRKTISGIGYAILLYGLLWVSPLHYVLKAHDSVEAISHAKSPANCLLCNYGTFFPEVSVFTFLPDVNIFHHKTDSSYISSKPDNKNFDRPKRGPPQVLVTY